MGEKTSSHSSCVCELCSHPPGPPIQLCISSGAWTATEMLLHNQANVRLGKVRMWLATISVKEKSLKSGLEVVDMETPQSTVVFGQRGLGRKDPDYFKARIVNYVLGGGGFQSRLYKEIREKNGLVYSIYSYLMPYEKDGLIVGGFQTRNKTVGETIDKLRND